MANRAELVGLNEPFFETERPALHSLLEGNYGLPLLWLALYRKEDIRDYENVSILLTSRESALASFDARRAGLETFLGAPAHPLIAQFRAVIEAHAYRYYLVNTTELQMLDDDFGANLPGYFDQLDQIVAGTAQTRELPVLTQADDDLTHYPYDGKPLWLCGFSYEIEVPWDF